MTYTVASVTQTLAAKYHTPYMVEAHSYISPFIQMIAASVSVSANRMMPRAE